MPISKPEQLDGVIAAARNSSYKVSFGSSVKELNSVISDIEDEIRNIGVSGKLNRSQIMVVRTMIDSKLKLFMRRWAESFAQHVQSANLSAESFLMEFGIQAAKDPANFTILMDRFRVYASRYVIDVRNRVGGIISTVQGESIDASALLEKITDSADGMFGSKYKAERISRTELSNAYNREILSSVEKEFERDNSIRLRWVERVSDATGMPLDKRVGIDSIYLHGQIRKPGEPFDDSVRGARPLAPPNRPHDRAIIVPVKSGWFSG